MNRKEAERLSERWFSKTSWWLPDFHKEHVELLLRTYRKGVKDGIVLGAVAVTPITKGRKK